MTIETGKIGGILPVLYSFFDEGGALRPGAFAAQTAHSMESGATGVVLFGFVTQFYRLTSEEKTVALSETAEALNGRGVLGVTVMESTAQGQIALIRAAEAAGADFIILQPPLGPPGCAPDWAGMILEVARSTALPVMVQNAHVAGTTLSPDVLADLRTQIPNLAGVKAETDSAEVAAFAREHSDVFRVLTGNWGVEYPFFRENGAHGLIPAPNFVPEQAAIHEALSPGGAGFEAALTIQGRILPLMQFIRERPTVERQLVLGKRALARRLGLAPCAGRVPGPKTEDPAIERHADRLARILS